MASILIFFALLLNNHKKTFYIEIFGGRIIFHLNYDAKLFQAFGKGIFEETKI